MTAKENYLTALKHGVPESIPYFGKPVRCNVGLTDPFEKGPMGGGYDGFGVRWIFSDGASSPATDRFVLTDITKWEEQVKFPDIDAIDWKEKARAELEGRHYDKETQVLEYCMGNGPFERMLALLGYQQLIDAFLEYPDECKALLKAWTVHRKHFIDIVEEHYHPDAITIYDDVAFERGLFLTKDMYEEFIQPVHKEINDYMWSKNIMPINHCCGKAEALIENFINEGCIAWTSCQPSNDIAGLLKKYHDRICIIGGFNSNGEPGYIDASEETRIAEVKRVIDDYSQYGSFIFGNMMFMCGDFDEMMRRNKRAEKIIFEYGDHWYEKHGIR